MPQLIVGILKIGTALTQASGVQAEAEPDHGTYQAGDDKVSGQQRDVGDEGMLQCSDAHQQHSTEYGGGQHGSKVMSR